MVFIKIDDQNTITYRHNFPFDAEVGLNKTEAELLQEGKLVPEPPEPGVVLGKTYIEKYDPATNSIVYEWIDIPKTPEQLREERVSALEVAMAQMLGM